MGDEFRRAEPPPAGKTPPNPVLLLMGGLPAVARPQQKTAFSGQRSRNLKTLDVDVTAGAIAVSRNELAVGTSSGFARFTYPGLEGTASMEDVWKEGCSGIQFTGAGILMLGQDIGQSFTEPADWGHALLHVDEYGHQCRVTLGPGNWTMVKGLRGTKAIVYDVSEGQGVRGVDMDRTGKDWAIAREFRRIVSAGTESLLAMTDSTVVHIAASDGRVIGEHDLPLLDEFMWTAVDAHAGGFVLGGHDLKRREYALARWRPGGAPALNCVPLSDVFQSSQIDAALADEDTCGADIFDVAALRFAPAGHLVIALGGDGERLGACQGACAIAHADAASLQFLRVQVVDECDGATGMLVTEDGGVVVNCCSSLYVLAPL